jgi:hypothetical protein
MVTWTAILPLPAYKQPLDLPLLVGKVVEAKAIWQLPHPILKPFKQTPKSRQRQPHRVEKRKKRKRWSLIGNKDAVVL